jgi:hypothetical protein
MEGAKKTLVYATRAFDPKDENLILARTDGKVGFKQVRWHDFYRFLRIVEKDALVEEIMVFMEEQGMARRHRFSTADLMALSGVPRAIEILDETLADEVKAELESFAGSRSSTQQPLQQIRAHGRYITIASLRAWDVTSFVGYQMRTSDGYPAAIVQLETSPRSTGREMAIAAMKRISLLEEWEGYGLSDPSAWANVVRTRSLASLLSEEDHIAAVKGFFVESLHQLRDELTAFKKEYPELAWSGE